MNLNYTTGIPDAPNNPSNDQPLMKTNTNSINSIIQIDHHGFGDTIGGYHTIIHQDAFTRSRTLQGNTYTNFPAAIPGPPTPINQLFVGAYTPDTTGGVADTQLFNKTGGGGVSQLTGSLTPAANESDGWSWCGGILIQWGMVTFSGTSQQNNTVTFKDRTAGAIPFPNNLFSVTATLHTAGGGPTGNAQTISVYTLNRTSFSWNYTGSSAYDRFYWMAIGF